MFCVSCGKKQPADAMYCPFCGAKQSVLVTTEDFPASQNNSAEVLATGNQVPFLDFSVTDLDPVYINSPLHDKWMFRYKNAAAPPPDWTSGAVDIMFSETHIFVQEQTTKKATLADYVKGVGIVAGVMTGTIASFVPVVGLAAGMTVMTVLAADRLKPKKKKHPGYGEHNQFTKEALIAMFAAGKGMWASRSECEFRALRAWRLGKFLDTHHYFAIIGKFHHISGISDLAAFLDVGYIADDYRKELVRETNCVISRDDKFKVRSEALRSLEKFPEPPITKELDD